MKIVEEWQGLCEGYAQWKAESMGIPYAPLWSGAPAIPYDPRGGNNPQRPDQKKLRRDAILLWAENAGKPAMVFCSDVEPALLAIPSEIVQRERERLKRLNQAEIERRLKSRGACALHGSSTYQA